MDRVLLAAAVIAAAIGVYPLVLYPLVVRVVARLRPRPWTTGAPAFEVAHVVTVHNEERRIRGKLENALAIRYPFGRADIVVTSDGSTDATESVVGEFGSRGIRWIASPRSGKEFAQLAAIHATTAPVIVFSDASTTLEVDSVERLLEPFADPSVGAVSGADVVGGEGRGTGEDLYVRYEMALRRAESLAGSLVGLSGCFFAVRREVGQSLKDDVPSDLGAALVCLSRGLRAVHAADARCSYTTTPSVEREFARKRRTALRGLRGLVAYADAFSASRVVATWQLLSHKVLRFLSPIFLTGAVLLLVAAAADGNRLALFLSVAVVAVLVVTIVSVFWPPARRVGPLRALAFLALSNAAVATALFDLASGRRAVQWTPTRRG